MNDPQPLDSVAIDLTNQTVRPVYVDGDAIYGLAPGTNGTGPAMRRQLAAPDGYRWVRHAGTPATGLHLVPGQRNPGLIPTPWGFCGVRTDGE